jgi:hypothetical protein
VAKAVADIRSLARTHSVMAINTLAKIAKSPKAADGARVVAANSLLDRGWGKAEQTHQVSDVTLQVVIRQIIDVAPQSDAVDALTIDHDDHS